MSVLCNNCGGPLLADDVFCGSCGTPVLPAVTAIVPPPRPQYVSALPTADNQATATTNADSPAADAPTVQSPPAAAPPAEAPPADAPPADAPPAAEWPTAAVQTETPATAIPATAIPAAAIPQAADPDDTEWSWYLGESTLIDMSVTGALDPLLNTRFLAQLARRFAIYATVTVFVDAVVFVLNLLVALASGSTGALVFIPVFASLSLLALLLVFFLLPVPALLAEWHRLLTFRAAAAGPTLTFIQQALERHHTPYAKLAQKPITPPGERRKLYLELQRGLFNGYISCFAYGEDLYVGWTFWIYVSPLRVIILRLTRKVQDYTGRGNDIYQTLRFESAQATVAAMHACALEGIKFAASGSSQRPAAVAVPADAAPEWPSSAGRAQGAG
jgi:hypothetical protein